MRIRDQQRSRVYQFDDRLNQGRKNFGLEGAKALVEKVRVFYGRPSHPTITDGRGRRSACASVTRIALPVFSRTDVIVLHECAHWITRATCGPKVAAHGREFVAVYVNLLIRFTEFDAVTLTAILRELNIDFASVDLHKPKSRTHPLITSIGAGVLSPTSFLRGV